MDVSELKGKKIALVLSGGMVKAAGWHLGVALALEDLGFTFKHNESPENADYEISTYVGSSAGSLVNLYFASGLAPSYVVQKSLGKRREKRKGNERFRPVSYRDMLHFRPPLKRPFKRSMKRPAGGRKYQSFEGFPLFLKHFLRLITNFSGFFSSDGLLKYIKERVIVANTFEEYKADLFVVASQLDHSRKVIFSKYDYPSPLHDPTASYYTGHPLAETVAASMSVPPFYSPYPLKNNKTGKTDYYIDGEIRETLSTHVAIDNQCDVIISSWTHTPYHYHDEIGHLIHYGLPVILEQAIYLLIQKKIVSSQERNRRAKEIIDEVSDYMRKKNFDEIHCKKILSIIQHKLQYNPNVKYINIYPKHDNYQLFFKNVFSLDKAHFSETITMGYQETMAAFKRQDDKLSTEG